VLFDLATYLGAYGAGLVAADLAQNPSWELAPPILPESPLSLTYEAPLYELGSERGWSVRSPYYFMPWAAAEGDQGVQFIALSTLHGSEGAGLGVSQATIRLVTSRAESPERFAEQC
jgi:hypothetical protein